VILDCGPDWVKLRLTFEATSQRIEFEFVGLGRPAFQAMRFKKARFLCYKWRVRGQETLLRSKSQGPDLHPVSCFLLLPASDGQLDLEPGFPHKGSWN
jgi:hypothetical protein